MEDKANSRLRYIDTAKAVAMYLIVVGHTQLYAPACKWIYTFHVPLFFFISGFLFSYDRNPCFKDFLRKRTRQIIIPYAAINIATYTIWLAAGRHLTHTPESASAEWWHPLLCSAVGLGGGIVHDMALWFLPCLFNIEIVYYVLFRGRRRGVVALMAVMAAVVGMAACQRHGGGTPLFMGQTAVSLLFYAAGHMARELRCTFLNLWVAAVAVALSAVCTIFNNSINYANNEYGNGVLFYTGALSGIYIMMCLCRLAERTFQAMPAIISRSVHRAVRIVADNTLWICGFHLLALSLVKGLLIFAAHYDISKLESSLLGNVAMAAVGMAVCTFATMQMRKFVIKKQDMT